MKGMLRVVIFSLVFGFASRVHAISINEYCSGLAIPIEGTAVSFLERFKPQLPELRQAAADPALYSRCKHKLVPLMGVIGEGPEAVFLDQRAQYLLAGFKTNIEFGFREREEFSSIGQALGILANRGFKTGLQSLIGASNLILRRGINNESLATSAMDGLALSGDKAAEAQLQKLKRQFRPADKNNTNNPPENYLIVWNKVATHGWKSVFGSKD